MTRTLIYCFIATILVVIFRHPLFILLRSLDDVHAFLLHQLSIVFAGGKVGYIIRHVFALYLIPVVIGGIAAAGFAVAKRKPMPAVAWVLWITWVVVAVLVVIPQ
jgi:hypothetical protein